LSFSLLVFRGSVVEGAIDLHIAALVLATPEVPEVPLLEIPAADAPLSK